MITDEIIIVNAMYSNTRFFIFRQSGQEIEFRFRGNTPITVGFYKLTDKEKQFINDNIVPENE